MPRYSAFIALRTGHYREIDEVVDAFDPRGAAQGIIDAGVVEADDDFPIILVVEERAISVFTRDRLGRVVTPTEGIRRRIGEQVDVPPLHVLADEPDPSGKR